MKLILLSAKAGTGKTTFANSLCKRIANSSIHSIASDLKRIVNSMHVDTNDKKQLRKKYQVLGEEINILDKYFWVSKTASRFNTRIIVVDDFRRKHEYEFLTERYDVTTVRLYRDIDYIDESDHISETDLDDFEFDIKLDLNDSSSVIAGTHSILEFVEGGELLGV